MTDYAGHETISGFVSDLRSYDIADLDAATLEGLLGRVSSSDFVAGCIHHLVQDQKDLSSTPGLSFYAVTLRFPTVLANALAMIVKEIEDLRLSGAYELAEQLSLIKSKFIQLSCGNDQEAEEETMYDLRGDHCGLYLTDHPELRSANPAMIKNSPFWDYCTRLTEERNIMRLIGAIMESEQGGVTEIVTAAEVGLINRGYYYELHVKAEVMHGNIAEEIARMCKVVPEWKVLFLRGMALHRDWYARATGL